MTDEPDEPSDPLVLMDEIEPLRESLRGIVAAFMSDGFNEHQARELAVSMMRNAHAGPAG